MTTGLLSNFPWFMPFSQTCFPSLNDNENDNKTISISWQNVLRWWMAQMRKDSWDDSLPMNIITCLLWSFRCYADSFAALHCFSQSRFIHLGHSCTCRSGLTIFILDEDSQGKGVEPCRWFATQTLASEWKAWSMLLWELIRASSNKLTSKLVSELEKRWWNCDLQLHWQVSYHTIQLKRWKRKRRAVKDAADAEVEV